MVVTHLHVAGYRSIRDLDLRLSKVNVLVGANGCGKSNLYRALHLLAEAAQGRLALAFAEEGGFPSALWASRPENRRVTRRFGRPDGPSKESGRGLPGRRGATTPQPIGCGLGRDGRGSRRSIRFG